MSTEKQDIQTSQPDNGTVPVVVAQQTNVPMAIPVSGPASEPLTGAVYRINGPIPPEARNVARESKFLVVSDRKGWVANQARNYVPEKITLSGLFGHTTLDFCNAIFVFPKTTISTSGLFHTVQIYVPHGVQVIMSGSNLLATMENRNVSQCTAESPIIEITGSQMLSSVTVDVNPNAPPLFISRGTA